MLFRGAGHWADQELVDALAEFGEVEPGLRGKMPNEQLSVWLARTVGGQSQHVA